MKIVFQKIRQVRLPLCKESISTPSALPCSDSIILEIETQKGIRAFGECIPQLTVSGESSLSVISDLKLIAPTLRKTNFQDLFDIQDFICQEISDLIGESSLCALEMALLSAFSQEKRMNLTELMGVELPQEINYSGVIPLIDLKKEPQILEKFYWKKVKLNLNQDLALGLSNIQILRDAWGDELEIQIDLQGSWTSQDGLEQIPVYLEAGIRRFEQPFSQEKDLLMRKLQKHYGDEVVFVADESLKSIKDTVRLIKTEACKGFNLKLSKLGGLFPSLAIYQMARKYGISCELGMYPGESSLLRYAGIMFASMAPELHLLEGALASQILSQDICHKKICFDTQGKLINSQELEGIANKVDTLRLDKYSSHLAYVA